MGYKTSLFLLALLLVLPLGTARAGSPFTGAAPARIVSLAPNLTELMFALGVEGRLVGRTQHCTYPQAAQALPVVGSFARPDLEKIVLLQPDLCLALQGATPLPLVQRLRDMGIPVLVLAPVSLGQLSVAVLELGQALHCMEQAEVLAQYMENRLYQVDTLVAQYTEHRRIKGLDTAPVTFFQLQEAPFILAGPASYIGEMLARAGAYNPLPVGSMYPRVGFEQLLWLRPDIIFISGMSNGSTAFASGRAQSMAATWNQWQSIPAVLQGRVHIVDADLFSRPSLRSLDALELLLGLLYPGGDS